ncbi:MAG: DegT/DnrJ/EryC1/StrS family aminotransferase [Gammaproteobacteria bacterium]|nr:DegT/DnrJ/EryC1/StrS family aminotransferase [Gammaproteobacteria bacterium]
MIKFLDLTAQYHSIKTAIDAAVFKVIEKAEFIGGEKLAEFETAFADYCDSNYCIGVGNGTDAIEIALQAADLPPHSEVIVPGNTFIASAEAVTRTNHTVRFADVDPDTYTISAETAEPHINGKTGAILAVHLYGHPCDMDPIMELANKHHLVVIEDCAQAHGARYKGRKVGSMGHFGAFSFYPGKNLGAYGDAGAITVKDETLAGKLRKIANHGRSSKFNHEFEGRNSRLDGLQAAVLSVKLQHLERWTKRRIEIARQYASGLAHIPDCILPVEAQWSRHVYHLFVIRVKDRDGLKSYLYEKGIQTGIHYPVALAKLEAYRYLGQAAADTFCNRTDSQLLSLPMGEHLTDDNVQYVINSIRTHFGESQNEC